MGKSWDILPPVSRYSSRKEWEEACWVIVAKSERLLGKLTTANERRNLVMRAAVADRISIGKKYRQIADELWLSPQTISTIRKALKKDAYRSYRERSKTERKKRTYDSLPVPRRQPLKKKSYDDYGIIQKI